METIFKVGDRVYDGTIGLWGTIVKIDDGVLYPNPICVDFSNGIPIAYRLDGRRFIDSMPTLSFTEYDFVNGGFSQVRPLPQIEKDQLVYVKLQGNREWHMRYFSHFDENGYMWFFSNQKKSTEAESVTRAEAHEYSIENPLK